MCVAEETDSGKVELKALDAKLHGWDVDPDEIQICQRDDGSDWVLGTGTFGAVRRPTPTLTLTLQSGPGHIRGLGAMRALHQYVLATIHAFMSEICDCVLSIHPWEFWRTSGYMC